MVNTLKPLFLAGVLAAAAYGVFTLMGGGAPSKPPVELEDGWDDGPVVGGPGMLPPVGAASSGPGEPAGMAPLSSGVEAPPFDPGAASAEAPPFQPLGEAPAADYGQPAGEYAPAGGDQAGLTPGVTPPLPSDVADHPASQPPAQQQLLGPPLSDPLGSPVGSAIPSVGGNLSPQVNEFGSGEGEGTGVGHTHQHADALTGEQAAAGGFAVAMTSISVQLEQQKVAAAQLALSQWYGDPSLTAQQEEQLLTLLDQLTGTVVYSQQHQLEPAYVVRQGDTLESVASQFNVPAQLLANINGMSVTDTLESGTKLKVVSGPFAASLDLDNYRLTLWLGERYAGRFAVGIGNEQPITPREYVVETKITNPTYYGSELTIAADDPTNPLGEHWMGLGGNVGLHGTIDPQSIGVAANEGCVRLGAQDVQDVFDILSIGSRVIVHEAARPTAQTPAAPGQTARF